MRGTATSWLPTLVWAIACSGHPPDVASFLPDDAQAFVVFAPSKRLRESLEPILNRVPEAAGVADLVRSVVGIGLDSDDTTMDNGLDPRGRTALALWEDAVLLLLPIHDRDRALRRLRLRLARLGFVWERTGNDGLGIFRSQDRTNRLATLGTASGVAFVCLGDERRCATVRPGSGWDPGPVVAELGQRSPAAVGLIRNPLLTRYAMDLGLSIRDPGLKLALALLQDVRWSVSLDQTGVLLRVAAGPSGPEISPVRTDSASPGRAAVVAITLPAGVETAVARLLAGPGPWERWTGEAAAVVLASESGASLLPTDLWEVIRRAPWVAAFRFRGPGDAQVAWRVLVGLERPTLGDSSDPTPGQSLPLVGAPRVVAVSRVVGDVVLVGSDAGQDILSSVKTHEMLPARDGATVIRLWADPAALLESIGGTGLEYLVHMVRSVRGLRATLAFEAGRWVLDVEARLR